MSIKSSKLTLDRTSVDFFKDWNVTNIFFQDTGNKLANFLLACLGEPYYQYDGTRETLIEVAASSPTMKLFANGALRAQASHIWPFLVGPCPKFSHQKTWADWKDAGVRLWEDGVLPLFRDDLPQNTFIRSAIKETVSRLLSWQKCNALAKERCDTLQNEIANYKKEIKLDVLQQEWQEFLDFAQAAERDSNVRFSGRFLRHWQRLSKSIALSEIPDSSYDVSWLLKLYGSSFAQYLDTFIELRSMIQRSERAKNYARYKQINEQSPIAVRLGGNYINYALAVHEGRFVLSFNLMSYKNIAQTTKHEVACKRSGYFQFPSTKKLIKGSKAYQINYNKCHEDFVGIVNEPVLKQENNGVNVYLSHNISPVENKRAYLATKYFESALGTNTEKTKPSVFYGMRVMTIDLGLRPIFSYSICELSQQPIDSFFVCRTQEFGYACEIEKGQCGFITNGSLYERITKFRNEINALRIVIQYCKKLQNGSAKSVPVQHLATLGLESNLSYQQLRDAIHKSTKYLRSYYRQLRGARIGSGQINVEYFRWISSVNDLIKVLKSWARFGRKPKSAGETYAVHDFSVYYRYLDNLKKNFVHKLAGQIRRLATENNVHTIILEDMENFQTSLAQDTAKNELLSLWPHRKIVHFLEQAAEPYGIVITLLDPRHSSQTDPETNEYGRRGQWIIVNNCKRFIDKESLYVVRGGKYIKIDSDIAACRNLHRRFWTRFAEITYMRSVAVSSSSCLVPILSSKRIRGALHNIYGSEYVLLEKDGDIYKITAVEKSIYDKTYADRLSGKHSIACYRHGDHWLDHEQHRAATDRIFDCYQASLQKKAIIDVELTGA